MNTVLFRNLRHNFEFLLVHFSLRSFRIYNHFVEITSNYKVEKFYETSTYLEFLDYKNYSFNQLNFYPHIFQLFGRLNQN